MRIPSTLEGLDSCKEGLDSCKEGRCQNYVTTLWDCNPPPHSSSIASNYSTNTNEIYIRLGIVAHDIEQNIQSEHVSKRRCSCNCGDL